MRRATLPALLVSLTCLTACPRNPDQVFTTGFNDGDSESPTESDTDETTDPDESETDETETETETGDEGECGDGIVDSDEECDNGPNNPADAERTTSCLNAACVHGLVPLGPAACGDGNPIDH